MNSFDSSDYFILINLGPIHAYPDIFENKKRRFFCSVFKKYASTSSEYIQIVFVRQYAKTLNNRNTVA